MLVEQSSVSGNEFPITIPDAISVGSSVAFDTLVGDVWYYETGVVTSLSSHTARVSVSHTALGPEGQQQLEMGKRRLAELAEKLCTGMEKDAIERIAVRQREIAEARAKVSGIEAACLREIQSYKTPSTIVKYILSDVIEIIGHASRGSSWVHVKNVIGHSGFISLVLNFDSSKVSSQRQAEILQRRHSKSITVEQAYKSSHAAGPLHEWVLSQLGFFKELESASYLNVGNMSDHLVRLIREIASLRGRINNVEGDPYRSLTLPRAEERIILRSSIITAFPTTYNIPRLASFHRPELLRYITKHRIDNNNNNESGVKGEFDTSHESYDELEEVYNNMQREYKRFKIKEEEHVSNVEFGIASLQEIVWDLRAYQSDTHNQVHSWGGGDAVDREIQTQLLQEKEHQVETGDFVAIINEIMQCTENLENRIGDLPAGNTYVGQEVKKLRKLGHALNSESERLIPRKIYSYAEKELETLRRTNDELQKELEQHRVMCYAREEEFAETQSGVAKLQRTLYTMFSPESAKCGSPTLHRISLDGDDWDPVLAQHYEEFLQALTCDIFVCCETYAECASEITYSDGRLCAEFHVFHDDKCDPVEIDRRTSVYSFCLARSLRARCLNAKGLFAGEGRDAMFIKDPHSQIVSCVDATSICKAIPQNEEQQESLEESRAKVKKLQDELAKLREENNKKSFECTKKEREIKVLQACVDKATRNEKVLKTKLEQAQRTIEALQHTLDTLPGVDKIQNMILSEDGHLVYNIPTSTVAAALHPDNVSTRTKGAKLITDKHKHSLNKDNKVKARENAKNTGFDHPYPSNTHAHDPQTDIQTSVDNPQKKSTVEGRPYMLSSNTTNKPSQSTDTPPQRISNPETFPGTKNTAQQKPHKAANNKHQQTSGASQYNPPQQRNNQPSELLKSKKNSIASPRQTHRSYPHTYVDASAKQQHSNILHGFEEVTPQQKNPPQQSDRLHTQRTAMEKTDEDPETGRAAYPEVEELKQALEDVQREKDAMEAQLADTRAALERLEAERAAIPRNVVYTGGTARVPAPDSQMERVRRLEIDVGRIWDVLEAELSLSRVAMNCMDAVVEARQSTSTNWQFPAEAACATVTDPEVKELKQAPGEVERQEDELEGKVVNECGVLRMRGAVQRLQRQCSVTYSAFVDGFSRTVRQAGPYVGEGFPSQQMGSSRCVNEAKELQERNTDLQSEVKRLYCEQDQLYESLSNSLWETRSLSGLLRSSEETSSRSRILKDGEYDKGVSSGGKPWLGESRSVSSVTPSVLDVQETQGFVKPVCVNSDQLSTSHRGAHTQYGAARSVQQNLEPESDPMAHLGRETDALTRTLPLSFDLRQSTPEPRPSLCLHKVTNAALYECASCRESLCEFEPVYRFCRECVSLRSMLGTSGNAMGLSDVSVSRTLSGIEGEDEFVSGVIPSVMEAAAVYKSLVGTVKNLREGVKSHGDTLRSFLDCDDKSRVSHEMRINGLEREIEDLRAELRVRNNCK